MRKPPFRRRRGRKVSTTDELSARSTQTGRGLASSPAWEPKQCWCAPLLKLLEMLHAEPLINRGRQLVPLDLPPLSTGCCHPKKSSIFPLRPVQENLLNRSILPGVGIARTGRVEPIGVHIFLVEHVSQLSNLMISAWAITPTSLFFLQH